MTFKQAYKSLEEDFSQRVEEDKSLGIESIFLPNIEPDGPVDYVLVGMEPSLGTWGKDSRQAREKIDGGFRNFCGVWILHCPVRNYLCRNGETYYLTDLARGAMPPNSPHAGNDKKYERWYPLFEREMSLVAKPDAKIISIGTKVGLFLLGKGLHGHAGMIPHYSTTASRYWGKEIPGREAEFKEFAAGVHKWPGGKPLSEPQKKLMFDYKVRFERIRNRNWSV